MTTYIKNRAILTILFCCSSWLIFCQSFIFQPNELIVQWKQNSTLAEITDLRIELKVQRSLNITNSTLELWIIGADQKLAVPDLVNKYKNHPNIELIEPNYLYTIDDIIPNDPLFTKLWGLNNIGQNPEADINATAGWGIKQESASIKVAVIDTGIDWGHPDLVDNIWQNSGEDADGDGHVMEWIEGQWVFDPGDENGIDDDNNGYVDDFVGWDFYNNDNNPYDDNGHGTHVAGTIGAKGNNGIGVAGVTWNVQMAGLKFLSGRGGGRNSDAIAAVNYAVNMGMHISNNSWGGGNYSTSLYNAIQNGANQNHLFIAAAGNNGFNTDITPIYPAAYNLDNIVSVTATDSIDNLAHFSNYGATTVDLGAPGTKILSCFPNNSYRELSGTSMATPHVTGACALLMEQYPNTPYADLKDILLSTVDPIPALTGKTLSEGRLNLCKLLGGCTGNLSCAYRDSLALVDLYNATNGPNWINSWDLSQPINTWFGVSTNNTGCVTQINLRDNQLNGNIPASLGSLSNLVGLSLERNQLSGSIPTELGNLTNLVVLDLGQNQLIGSIPVTLGNLVNIISFDLSQNQLTGSIPASLGNLIKVQTLGLDNNQLTGAIPNEIWNLVALKYLYLNRNQLSGGIPTTIGNLINLEHFYLSNNLLSGIIPGTIGNLTNLKLLYFNDNMFSGSIPPEFGNLSLQHFFLNNNQLIGCFPLALSPLCNSLSLSNVKGNPDLPNGGDFSSFCNNGAGTCSDCSSNDSLALIALYNATNGPNWTNTWDLNQPFSTWQGVTTNSSGCVITLDLDNNQLIGTIPAELGNLANLQILYLYNNQLSGSISSALGSLVNLQQLYLYNNQLTGAIPNEIGNLINLQYLALSQNQLTGTIPASFSNLTDLRYLYLYENQLTGTIPTFFGNFNNIERLYLYSNQLTGTIPTSLGNLTTLLKLFLNENQLTGTIPTSLGNLANLEFLYLYDNQLTGSIPTELSNLSKLQKLYLSENKLTGTIPTSLGSLSNLERLYLYDNQLTGTIPSSLGDLSNLQQIYLNQNQLSGCFPQSFSTFCTIDAYNFTDNFNLPNGGDFAAFCIDGTGGCCPDPVWPGDFNDDGIANNTDVLFWGLACKDTPELVRPNASTSWFAQESSEWTASVNGVNSKHQDGNGDGVINGQDLQVLFTNYGKNHTNATSLNYQTNGLVFRLEPIINANPNILKYGLFVELDGQFVSLHGAACSINFRDLPVTGASFDITDSSLNPNEHLDTFNLIENTLHIALTRTDKSNQLVDGPLGILIVIVDNVATGDPILLNVEKGSQITADGTLDVVGNASLYSTYSEIAASSNNLLLNVSLTSEQCDQLGSAKVNMIGGTAPYTIEWSTGETTEQINNLVAGIYTVIVRDANGLEVTYTVEIEGQFQLRYNSAGELVNCNTLNCLTALNIENNITDGVYQSSIIITANGNIPLNNQVTFKAGHSITLKPGFTVKSGATFLAKIEACSSNNLNFYTENLALQTDNCGGTSSCAYTDSLALVAFYNATNGANWVSTWNLNQPINTWFGVTTNNNGCVIAIWNNSNQLTGSIPAEIGNLSNLQTLSLSNNQLTGSIPVEIGNLPNLEHLSLHNNQLTGSIPITIGTLSNLNRIYIFNNQLTGGIPTEIGNLSNLQDLSFNNNQLTGSIPSSLGNLSNLGYLRLNNNQLSGCFPQSIATFCNINYDLSNNPNLPGAGDFAAFCTNGTGECTGNSSCTYPDSLVLVALYNATDGANWTTTWDLNTPTNTWYGITLNGLGCVTNINLTNNNLVGNIPVELGNLNSLIELMLPSNSLTGSIPPELSNLDRLTILELSTNNLTGNIPPELGNLSNLESLLLRTNQLTGSIPAELGNLNNLVYLSLFTNQLTGSIPSELGDFVNLNYLGLSNNQLTGSIPSELGSLVNLLELRLNDNQLTGSIPPTLGALSNLDWLHISFNQLTGSIPTELGNLNSLKGIYLNFNQLTGSIPVELGSLTNLTRLQLNNNQLSGNIPPELGNLTNITKLALNNNQLEGCFPLTLQVFCDYPSNTVITSNNPSLPGSGSFNDFCVNGVGACATFTSSGNATSRAKSSNIVTQSKQLMLSLMPNPVKQEAIINYDLPNTSRVNLIIYDLQGKVVKILQQKELRDMGSHQVKLNASNYANGMYIVRLETDRNTKIVKMIVTGN